MTPSEMKAGERLRHVWDDDAVCEHCGFDGAEAHHLRAQTHPDDREPTPHYEIYCEVRERKQRDANWGHP